MPVGAALLLSLLGVGVLSSESAACRDMVVCSAVTVKLSPHRKCRLNRTIVPVHHFLAFANKLIGPISSGEVETVAVVNVNVRRP